MANHFCLWLDQLVVAAHAGRTVDLADLRLAAVGQFLCICPEVSRYWYPGDAGFWESVELSATVHF